MDVREFPWVSNQAKALRAAAVLKKEGKEVTEQAVKDFYIKYGGLIMETDDVVEEVEEKKAKKAKKAKKDAE